MNTATYSPEDNKLRLYAEARLDAGTYARVKAAGFKWAPKQELFVAPMWTPDREDLLLELCGEIGDEDKTLMERQEERAERFEDYGENRKEDARQARETVGAIANNIPLGQPILVGHHSEKRARKDAERIENGMRKAIKMWDQAQYWQARARSAISHAKYKERPDVRARRIKTLEAEQRKRIRAKNEAEHLIRFWNGELFAKNPATGERRPITICEENRAWLCELLGRMPACGVRMLGIDGQNYYSAWDCFQPEETRYKNCPVKTVAEVQESALRLQAGVIERANRWIAHYDNRLAYERAMLAEDGGTAADRKGPESGGACRCWASPRGGWSYIQKVNKVSVTVLDNWGNGGANFTRTIPFDKLAAVMSAAEVQAARDCGTLIEVSDKTGFVLCGNDAEAVRALPDKPSPQQEHDQFKALKQTLAAGVQVVSANQLFPTPPELAAQLVEYANIESGNRILEPSAGSGNILRALADLIEDDNLANVVAVEVNLNLAHHLAAGFPNTDVRRGDFLTFNGELGKFDRIVMNPPFANGQDLVHIKHALNFLNPSGRLVAICANGPRQRGTLEPIATSWIDLEPGAFKESGTDVRTAIVVIDKDTAEEVGAQ